MAKSRAEINAAADAKRTKTWTIVLYPEDLPDDWEQRLQSLQVPMVLSPLHDSDMNADGTLKKPHHHAVLMYSGKKSAKQVRGSIVGLFGETVDGAIYGVAAINDHNMVHDRRAMVRYLVHLDNPEKAQYDVGDIKGFNGADVQELLSRSLSEVTSILKEILQFVEDNDITEFCDLVDLIRDNNEWFTVAMMKQTYSLTRYINSRRHKHERGQRRSTVTLYEQGSKYGDDDDNE